MDFPLTLSSARAKAGRWAVSPVEQTKQFKVISLYSHTHHQPLTKLLFAQTGQHGSECCRPDNKGQDAGVMRPGSGQEERG